MNDNNFNYDEIKPFTLHVEESVLNDLKERLSKTRWPDQLNSPINQNWLYGAELNATKEWADYWLNNFNWRENESKFNNMGSQFLTKTKDGRILHFLHQRSTNVNAKPIIISHGWPGTIYEFHKIIPLLTNDFHIVCPSIPGYGFSEAFHVRNGNTVATARDYHDLMIKLGYKTYYAQGGDWGSSITKTLAVLFSDHCIAMHTNMPRGIEPDGFDENALTPVEIEGMRKTKLFTQVGQAYQKIQGQKPQTLSYGLNDSPVGLMAWILEKFHSWTWNKMELLTKDEILTIITIYWVTSTIGSSIRYYFENGSGAPTMPGVSTERQELRNVKVKVPSACVHFPEEISQLPLSWLHEAYNMIRYNRFDVGGHFAAFETPEILANDIKEFFLVDVPNYYNNARNVRRRNDSNSSSKL